MKSKDSSPLRRKAAAAALALAWISAAAGPTIPPLPDDRAAFEHLERIYRFRQAGTPLEIREFLNGMPESGLSAEATLMLADWHFYNHEFAAALACYDRISDNAFSGDVREGMLYRKAFSLLKCGYYDQAAPTFRGLSHSKDFGLDSRFYTAYIDYVKGRYDEAYRQFKSIAGAGSKGAEAEYYLNQIDYLNGDYRKVASTSERLLTTGRVPEELLGETMRVAGLSYFKIGDKTTARSILERYSSRAGDGAEIAALYALASIYYDEGAYSKALPLFSIVTDYPGDLAQSSWLYIGQIHLSEGDVQAAALAFDKAAKESWDHSVAETAAFNLAVTAASGMALPFSDAAAAMESFVETYPDSPYASSLSSYLANAYYARRDYAAALRQADRLTGADARGIRQKILYQLGVAQLQQGDVSDAVRSLSEAASSGQPDREVGAQAALWLGDAYYAKKDYRAAARAYGDAIASGLLGDNTALAKYDLGYACMKLRDYTKAEAAFREAMTMPGLQPRQKADARLRYADCLYYNGKYSQALSIFRDIRLEGGSDAVFARIREADILGKDGKVAEKISILEELSSSPDAGVWLPTVLSRLADSYSEKGDDRKAAALYARILDNSGRETDNSQTYYSLATNAENLYKAGDMASAYAAYKRLESSGIAALYPEAVRGVMLTSADAAERAEYAAKAAALPGISPEEMDRALFTGAIAALELGGPHTSAAKETLDALARSADRYWGAQAAVALGEQLLREGNPAAAEEILLYLIDNGSDDNYWLARGYITLADAYAAMDKDYLARLYLETLKGNYPGDEKDIRQMIDSRLKTLAK